MAELTDLPLGATNPAKYSNYFTVIASDMVRLAFAEALQALQPFRQRPLLWAWARQGRQVAGAVARKSTPPIMIVTRSMLS
jgi:hypothetical protein